MLQARKVNENRYFDLSKQVRCYLYCLCYLVYLRLCLIVQSFYLGMFTLFLFILN